ncbi:serine/threonine protein kinase [Pirellula staleyi DSM 6068]|uniref:Serine/threonine protein kinase n=1 Tax=Pirellula staleyi (strain ATCC 27377 / DSM 6068 / ICPB 4128) TaxID=530564 RepID=D2R6W7_PIRSD|nr:protein kinase [Pirellula staleyi]ADB19170.1 serine/threonine protein kinase [Pirellula staleyi DSM 6068]
MSLIARGSTSSGLYPTSAEGPIVGRYHILGCLSTTADGVAYHAIDVADSMPVELRVLTSHREDSARRRELFARYRLLSLASSPSIRPLLACEEHAVPPLLAIAFPRATPLTEYDATTQTFDARLRLARSLVAALLQAHRVGLVHGGIQPSAIQVTQQGYASLDFTGWGLTLEEQQSADAARDLTATIAIVRWLLDSDLSVLPQLAEYLTDFERSHAPSEFAVVELLAALDGNAIPTAETDFSKTGEVSIELFAPPDGMHPARELAPDKTAEVPIAPMAGSGAESLLANLPDATHHQPVFGNAAAGDGGLLNAGETYVIDTWSSQAPVASRHRTAEITVGTTLGRYQIESRLGEGGMGVVYKAIDQSSGQVVALKVLHPTLVGRGNSLKRFRKEARMLAAVNNPLVTNLYEANEDQGLHFLAMEFIDGIDLKKVLGRLNRLPESLALKVVADVARALADAHEKGIVHRDIKPENILVLDGEALLAEDLAATSDPTQTLVLEPTQFPERLKIKLSDFGIARQVNQSESLAATQAGAILGTPYYMAPEQCQGKGEIVPPTDIYALGCTLFELLAGRPPFLAEDAMKIASMHCFEAPPALRKINPEVSEQTQRLVERCLAKKPADRFADAAHFLTELDQLRGSESRNFQLHPVLPRHDPGQLFRADFSWDLQSTAAELWPLVSNTERLNRAMGLPSVVYRTEHDPERGTRKFGSFRLAGMTISWEEHPFEWVEGRRMGILREFTQGPFKWFLSTVELTPLPEGGTRLDHRIRIEPRNFIGWAVANMEVKWKGQGNLDRVYRRIDQTLLDRPSGRDLADPFESPQPLSRTSLKRLEDRAQLLIARGVRREVADLLEKFLREASAQEVAKIRPLTLANRLDLDPSELTEALLHAAAEGLVTLHWDVLCPTCRVPSDACDTLREIEKHNRCEACNLNFELDLASSVELVFRVHPEIRAADTGMYCIGGPEHSPHVAAQVRLEAGERMELQLALEEGEYLIRTPQMRQQVKLRVRAVGPGRSAVEFSPTMDDRRELQLRAVNQLLELSNASAATIVVRVERTIARGDVVTAAQASSLALFRELFPQEMLAPGQLMSVQTITILAAAIDNLDELFATLGDAGTFGVIERHYQLLDQAARRHRGTIVKFAPDAVIASFADPAGALRAAIDTLGTLRHEASQRAEELGKPPIPTRLKIALHRGPALVTTLQGRLDYFGTTERSAAILAQRAAAGDLLVTDALSGDAALADVVAEHQLEVELTSPGVKLDRISIVERLQLPSNSSLEQDR